MKSLINQFKLLLSLLIFYSETLGKNTIIKVLLSGITISFLEIFGLALLLPFMKIIIDKKITSEIIILMSVALIFTYLLRGYLNFVLIKFQTNIAALLNTNLSNKIISKSLSSRYELFVDFSPVKIASASYTNTMHTALLFQSICSLINESTLLLIIFLGAFILNPKVFILILLALFTLFILIFRPISKHVAKLGRETQKVDYSRHRFIFTMSNAIKDIKIMGLENPFIKRNQLISSKHSNLFSEYTYFSSAQRLAIESFLASGVVIAVLFFYFTNTDLNKNAPFILTLGMLVIRSAPSISRLSNAFSGIKYSKPFFDDFKNTYKNIITYPQIRNENKANLPGDYKIRNIFFNYGQKPILLNCSLSINSGEVILIIGESGSGKSTLLDIISGLIPAKRGQFYIGNINFNPFESSNLPKRIGYVPQSISLLDDTLSYNITFSRNPNLNNLKNAIKQSNLKNFINELPNGLNTIIGDEGQGISGGQRQRIGIARALYKKPSLLILDEITSSLDEQNSKKIINEILKMRGKVSIIFVSHNIKYIEANKIYELKRGRLNLISSKNK